MENITLKKFNYKCTCDNIINIEEEILKLNFTPQVSCPVYDIQCYECKKKYIIYHREIYVTIYTKVKNNIYNLGQLLKGRGYIVWK